MRTSHRLAFTLGLPLSPVYAALMKFRSFCYRKGVFRNNRLPVPVISVGNLTLGGTGKTPMVIAIARFLQQEGFKPGIVSRGYGGKARQEVNIVSDGESVFLDVEQSGDEPRLMAEALPGVPVVTGAKRSLVADYTVRELGAELIIMDDGFQHLALHRDLDLVLFKAPDFLGNGRVFPGGELREPLSALQRAQGFVLTGVDESSHDAANRFEIILSELFTEKPVFQTHYAAARLLDREGKVVSEEDIAKGLYGFCGLANPASFRVSLVKKGIEVKGFKSFPDHHLYSQDDFAELTRAAEQVGAGALVTTNKDLVKLLDISSNLPLFILHVEQHLPDRLKEFVLTSIRVVS